MNGQIGTALLRLRVETGSVGAGQVAQDVERTDPRWGGLAPSSSPQSAIEAGFEGCPLLFESRGPGQSEERFGDFRVSRLVEGDSGHPLFREVFQTLGRV